MPEGYALRRTTTVNCAATLVLLGVRETGRGEVLLRIRLDTTTHGSAVHVGEYGAGLSVVFSGWAIDGSVGGVGGGRHDYMLRTEVAYFLVALLPSHSTSHVAGSINRGGVYLDSIIAATRMSKTIIWNSVTLYIVQTNTLASAGYTPATHPAILALQNEGRHTLAGGRPSQVAHRIVGPHVCNRAPRATGTLAHPKDEGHPLVTGGLICP